jgi:hypothetical protein
MTVLAGKQPGFGINQNTLGLLNSSTSIKSQKYNNGIHIGLLQFQQKFAPK